MLADAMARALGLVLHPSAELVGIVLMTFKVSGGALFIATALGLPMGAALALGRFPLRGAVLSVLNAMMGLPPVVVGLVVYLLLSRSGLFGFMSLLYTPSAMVIAQCVLALPIVSALTVSAVTSVDPSVRLTAQSLGATPAQVTLTIIREARFGILAAIIAALGRVMAEVGAILIVGGNIKGYTRVMTSTIAMETDKGDFTLAIALGMILLSISVIINIALHALQRHGRRSA